MCCKRHRELRGCPHEKETNHSEPDYMSDRTVMAGIVFTGDAAAAQLISNIVGEELEGFDRWRFLLGFNVTL